MDYNKLLNDIRQIVAEELDFRFFQISASRAKRKPRANRKFITIEEAATFTNFPVRTLYEFVKDGFVPFVRQKGNILFPKRELNLWMERNGFYKGRTIPKDGILLGNKLIRKIGSKIVVIK